MLYRDTLSKESDNIGAAIEIVRKLIRLSALPEQKADFAFKLACLLDDYIYATYQELM